MIVFISDIEDHALPKITCTATAMVYSCMTDIDSIDAVRTQPPTEIREMVAW